ncbi:hypothetical protein COV24_01715 [candidate division WWE3 bacterium CG10_big_fil_rev_8_21_14_0_10_32_10]|uniref:histidine kinase n=1 Tax=candidate division WWE3 bacterium CG10_big_fil_rev_8_21_14_0_10_32_10 TaxID=1975090 RepID=A0A2H0RAX0_UNCKA|nr:MAG: hypothetical protein COV24_01715 [candidate division WWE3 bacterium CG10_big_fil_rev_8_21_14_0_10_32_10]
MSPFISFFLIILIIVVLYVVFYAYGKEKQIHLLREEFDKKNEHLRNRVYELTILQEISSRIGYSLKLEKVADILAGSLGDVIEYSVSSFLIKTGAKIKFKAFLRESVHPDYVRDLQRKSLEAFGKESGSNLSKYKFEDYITGALLSNEEKNSPQSFFAVPLVLDDEVVGIISVSSLHPGIYKNSEGNIKLLKTISLQAMNAVSNLQKLLVLEKSKLTTMVESLVDGVFFIDKSMKVLVSNTSAKHMLGLKKKNITILDIISALEDIGIKDKIAQGFKLSKSFVIPDSEIGLKHLKIIITPVLGDKKPLGVVLLIQDITRQKQLEKMRDDFTSMMVHDLRAPLTVMVGSSDILMKKEKQLTQEQKTRLLFDLKKGANSLLDIVNDLLDVAKMENGKYEVTKSLQDLNDFVVKKADYYRGLIEERGLVYKINPLKNSVLVNFDENLIGRVLSNLLSNANKYTESGSITIDMKVDSKKEYVKVSVTDTGVGISREAQKMLFNKFEQLRNPVDSKQKGTGLGLVIAKNIVESHGGKIGINSVEGKGSTFWFTLPIYKKNLTKKLKA